MLVGDSIRLGYQPIVASLLAGEIDVRGTRDNCASSRDILEHYDRWIVAYLAPATTVHLNAGLHDLRRLGGVEGAPHVGLDEYQANLSRILDRLHRDGCVARVVPATSTPVDDVRHGRGRAPTRFQRDVAAYNRALRSVAEAYHLVVHDLEAVIAIDPDRYLADDGVHLTAAGDLAAASSLAAVVRTAG